MFLLAVVLQHTVPQLCCTILSLCSPANADATRAWLAFEDVFLWYCLLGVLPCGRDYNCYAPCCTCPSCFLPCGRDSFSIAVAMPLTVTFHRWPMPTQPLSGSLPRTFSLIQASGFSETAATTHAVSFFSISPANADENRVRTVSEDVPSLCFLFCEKDSLVLAVVTSHVSLSFAGQCRRG